MFRRAAVTREEVLKMQRGHARLVVAIKVDDWARAVKAVEELEAIGGIWPGLAEYVRQQARVR